MNFVNTLTMVIQTATGKVGFLVESLLLSNAWLFPGFKNTPILYNLVVNKFYIKVGNSALKFIVWEGGFFSESTCTFVISSNIWNFYFPELENLNFGDWKLA